MSMLSRRLTPYEQDISALFNGETSYTQDDPEFDKSLVILAFFNRSGSNLLNERLVATHKIRSYGERANYDVVRAEAATHGLTSFPDYFRYVEATLSNPLKQWSLFKASYDQLAALGHLGILRMYKDCKVVHIIRQDILGQAVSHQIATQTLQWTSSHESTGFTPQYDEKALDTTLSRIAFVNGAIPMMCEALDLPWRQVSYEDLCTEPDHVLRKIGEFLDVDVSRGTGHEPRLKQQATAINADFAARYLNHARQTLTTGTQLRPEPLTAEDMRKTITLPGITTALRHFVRRIRVR